MDRESLRDRLRLRLVDPRSCDTVTQSIRREDGCLHEELYLKEIPDANPSLETHGNIPCVLLRPEDGARRPAFLLGYSPDRSRGDLLERMEGLVAFDAVVLGVQVSPTDGRETVSRLLRGVSYLSLRRDAVDITRVYLFGADNLAGWALVAAALDDRVRGVLAIDPPYTVHLEDQAPVAVTELAELIQPRRVALIAESSGDVLADQVREESDTWRVESEDAPIIRKEVVEWLLQREGAS